MQISVHADMNSTKRGISQRKTPKITQSCSNQFSIPNANVPVTLQFWILTQGESTKLKQSNINTKILLFRNFQLI